jgi:hypothetical protein
MQKDAKVNIELPKASAAIAKASKEDSAAMKIIAFESKKDSSAMKTISILGMIFLPGTFVAVSNTSFTTKDVLVHKIKDIADHANRRSLQCQSLISMQIVLQS